MSASLQIKRIHKELRSLTENPPDKFRACSVHDNLFEWHFTIQGPEGSDFEEGLYHGKIELPAEYPIKPPNIFFLSPNGRFEIKTKICLNITKYHPENWNPSFTIRTMIEGLIQHFHVKDYAVGSIQYDGQHIRKIAKESHKWCCDICGPIIDVLAPYKKVVEVQVPKPAEEQEIPIEKEQPSSQHQFQFNNSNTNANTEQQRQRQSDDMNDILTSAQMLVFDNILKLLEEEVLVQGTIKFIEPVVEEAEQPQRNAEDIVKPDNNGKVVMLQLLFMGIVFTLVVFHFGDYLGQSISQWLYP